MNYVSEVVLNETVAEMRQAIADHLAFAGCEHLTQEVNAIVELTIDKLYEKYNVS